MAFRLVCPICRGKFVWDVLAGWPSECLLCHQDIRQNEDNVIAIPAILSNHSKVPDKVARDYMDGSEKRVHMAAELAGTTSEDMSSLKITNLSDRNDSQTNAMPVNNPVTQFMAQNPQAPIGFNGNGAQYATQVQSGPSPNMGAKMMTKVNSHHATISHGSAVSERPALETQQPGYRRRG